MRISASQIDTFEDCPRFWWFRRILKLAEPPASHFTFGTVLHAVCERYLSADKNQRVPGTTGTIVPEGPLKGQISGQPVNLYSKGWETVTERDGSTATVSKPEAKLIQRLIKEAIEEGILVWSEGAQVEREILLPVIDGVNLIGYIDVYHPAEDVTHISSRGGFKVVDKKVLLSLPLIEDHKTYSKGGMRFLKREDKKSPNYLGSNQQLKTYAWAISQDKPFAKNLEGVVVQHNQYPKFDGKPVTKVRATITGLEIEEHGEYLREVAERMVRTGKIKKWGDVPGPQDTGKCARWYGKPCCFSNICGHAETPDGYRTRLERKLSGGCKASDLDLPLVNKDKNTMGSIFDQANKQKAARTSRRKKAGTKKARADTPVNGAEPKTAVPVTSGAPWANPKCRACKGRGFTSKGKTCPLCDNTAKKGGRPTSMAYIVELDDDGLGIACAREDTVEELEAAGLPLEWIEVDAAEAAPEPAAEEQPEPEAEAAPAEKAPEEAAPEPKPKPEKATKGRKSAGRPKVGITLMLGANYLKGQPGGRPTMTSAEVLARFGAELAEDMGAESYWALDSFKRRERLAQVAEHLAGELGRYIIIHPGVLGNDDAGSLMQALMPYAETVITRVG